MIIITSNNFYVSSKLNLSFINNTMDISATTVQEKIKNYIVESSHANAEKIKSESLIFKEGFFDSMGFIMLITFLEEEFGIKTVDSDLIEENFESINAITRFIKRKTEE